MKNQINLTITWIHIDKIIPNNWNINSMSPPKFEALKESLKKRGFIEPILVRPLSDGYQIINGFHRYSASIELGIENLPCIIYDCNDIEAQTITIGANEFRGETDLEKFGQYINTHQHSLNELTGHFGISKHTLLRYSSYGKGISIKINDEMHESLINFSFLIPSPLVEEIDVKISSLLEERNKNYIECYRHESYLKTKEIYGNLIYQAIMGYNNYNVERAVKNLISEKYILELLEKQKRDEISAEKSGQLLLSVISCRYCDKKFYKNRKISLYKHEEECSIKNLKRLDEIHKKEIRERAIEKRRRT